MTPIPTITTERLKMRAPCEADIPAETAFFASERSHFVGGPLDAEQVWRAIASLIGHWVMRGYGFWGVEDRQASRSAAARHDAPLEDA